MHSIYIKHFYIKFTHLCGNLFLVMPNKIVKIYLSSCNLNHHVQDMSSTNLGVAKMFSLLPQDC
jgi:hypothetical protein